MATNIDLPPNVKDVLRERVLGTFVDLIPKEKLDAWLQEEIEAFFVEPRLLTVERTTKTIKNPQYDPNGGYYNNQREVSLNCVAFGSYMTPFRQLVWTCLHEHLEPKMREVLSAENSACKIELDKWFEEVAKPAIGESYKTMFNHLSMGMSSAMLQSVIRSAMETSHMNMMHAFNSVGINTSALPAPIVAPINSPV
jgi:hypothetical protein